MEESVCMSCTELRCISRGYPATQYEPAEDPQYECVHDSANYMSKDGCYRYYDAGCAIHDDEL